METKNDGSIVLNDVRPFYSVHPGDILREELEARGIKHKAFAASIGMEPPHLSALIHGKRNVTAPIAARLEESLGIPAAIWLKIQAQYDLDSKYSRAKHKMVNGYNNHGETVRAAILAEPSDTSYGNTLKKVLSLPEKDLVFLEMLSSRMGWKIE